MTLRLCAKLSDDQYQRMCQVVLHDTRNARAGEVAVVDVLRARAGRAVGAARHVHAVDVELVHLLGRPGGGDELRAVRAVVVEVEFLIAERTLFADRKTRRGAVEMDGYVDLAPGRRRTERETRSRQGQTWLPQ